MGTTDMLQIMKQIDEGDAHAKLLIDAMIFHTAKTIASEGAVLRGKVDAILLTGGIAHSEYITSRIADRVDYLGSRPHLPGRGRNEGFGAQRLLCVARRTRSERIRITPSSPYQLHTFAAQSISVELFVYVTAICGGILHNFGLQRNSRCNHRGNRQGSQQSTQLKILTNLLTLLREELKITDLNKQP